MDSHHLARKRGGDLIKTLAAIQTPTFIIGINSDILCPLDEQRFMEQHMPNATLVAIDSLYGHDGFIIEAPQITNLLKNWLVAQHV
jgi:homoserine O-acetyltransferase